MVRRGRRGRRGADEKGELRCETIIVFEIIIVNEEEFGLERISSKMFGLRRRERQEVGFIWSGL